MLQYVATKLHFELHSLSLALQDEIEGKDRKILCAEVTNVHADVLQRPSVGNLVYVLHLYLLQLVIFSTK